MQTLVDLSASPQINRALEITSVPIHAGMIPSCISILATGTFTGKPKLEVSQDGTNFYPAYNSDGEQIELESGKMIFVEYPRVFLRVDLTGVTSSDLKVTIQ